MPDGGAAPYELNIGYVDAVASREGRMWALANDRDNSLCSSLWSVTTNEPSNVRVSRASIPHLIVDQLITIHIIHVFRIYYKVVIVMRFASAKVLAVAVPMACSSAQTQELPAGWQPAMLILQADTMTASPTGEGQVITLENVHPLVSIVSRLHESRHFDSAAIGGFAEHYNTCNDMKHTNDWWHEDGANARLIYAAGPDNGEAAHIRRHLPLVTNPNALDATRLAAIGAGSIALFIDEADFDPSGQSLVFQVFGPAHMVEGVYENVTLLAECLDVMSRAD